MTSNSELDTLFDGRKLAEVLASVPPVPPAVVAMVGSTSYGLRYSSWATYKWNGTHSWNIPQMVTALVLLEQSRAGKEWGVQLAMIPSNIRAASDGRYSAGCRGGILTEVFAYIEWFFARSRLKDEAPGIKVKWEDPDSITSTNWPGIPFSCSAISKMLYAAQELESEGIKGKATAATEEGFKLAAMETKIVELEAKNATLGSEIQQVNARLQQVSGELHQVTSRIRHRAPTVTCLMNLFAGYTAFSYTNCDPASTCTTCINVDTISVCATVSDLNTGVPRAPQAGIVPDLPAPHMHIDTDPVLNIAPHTDRLSNLSADAQDWFLKQLDTRKVWVRATEPDSYDNHISWTPFSGAIEMSRKRVAFSYGNYRFW